MTIVLLFIALGSLNAADGWVSPSPLHWVPRIRCKLAAFPQRHVLYFFLLYWALFPVIDFASYFGGAAADVSLDMGRIALRKKKYMLYIYI